MADKQIQTINNRDYALARRSRPRGLIGQVGMVLLEPGTFFRALPYVESSRQWVWAALLILALVGFSAVRQEALLNGDTGSSGGAVTDPFANPDAGATVPVDPFASSGPFGGGQLPTVPTDPTTGSSDDSNVSATWTTALIAGSGVILGWFILAVMLCEVSLFNGVAPRLGSNFQIAIWTSAPIGLMAALQLLFYAAGGTVGEAGISGLLSQWDGYAALPTFSKSLLLSLTSHLTLFWLWSVVLIYVAGRRALNGKRWAVALVVIAWVLVVILAPVLTGAIAAPEADSAVPALLGDMPPDGLVLPDGSLPDFSGDADASLPAGDPFAELFAPSSENTPDPLTGGPDADELPEITPPAEGRVPRPPLSRLTPQPGETIPADGS